MKPGRPKEPSTSAVLNTALRAILAPVLRGAGFQHVDARNAWSWRDDLVWVFNLRAVGSYFSDVTGWPPGSILVSLGVYWTFAARDASVRLDKRGRLRPAEYVCHIRGELACGLDQSVFVAALGNPAERQRQDIWWVHRDGGNREEVAHDVARALRTDGLDWYARASDLPMVLARLEASPNSFGQYVKAASLAKHLGDEARFQYYDAMAEAAAQRIGRDTDRSTWIVSGWPDSDSALIARR